MEPETVINYCLDSNAVSDILRGHTDVVLHMDEAMNRGGRMFICSVVYYELVRGMKASGMLKRLREFYDLYYGLPLRIPLEVNDIRVLERASDIYAQLHKGQTIEDSDIFIAAISMVNGCVLVTDNVRHFSRIPGLRLVNWRMSGADDWKEETSYEDKMPRSGLA